MGPYLRAFRALVLLAGFYLLGLVLLAVLGVLDYLAFDFLGGAVAGKIAIVSVVLAVPIVRGMFMLRTPAPEPPVGIRVTEAQEPRLWRTVRELAEQVGTRAPDEILLVDEVNAAVGEEAKFLGLRGGKRTLLLGLPLMSGLDERRLRGVLGHELGHYSNSDTRLTPLIRRGHLQLTRTIEHFEERAASKVSKERARQEKASERRVTKGKKAKEIDTSGSGVTYKAMAKIYTAYAKFYLRATRSIGRRQELAADLAAARIVGRDAYASALREVNVLAPAYDFYLRCYAVIGTGAGLMPREGEFFGGFRHLLPARAEEFDELREDLPTEQDPYDSHPPLADRVARIEALPADGTDAQGADRPSLELLSDPAGAFAALERVVLTPEALALTRVDWEELVHRSMARMIEEGAEGIRRTVAAETGGSPETALPALLDAVQADPAVLWRIADRFPKSEEAAAATGRAAREFARPVVRRVLNQLVSVELTARGTTRWALSWSDSAYLRYPEDGFEDRLTLALDAAVADRPDTEPLRKLVLAS
ncbi:M48 family metallopeptidase [Streptomyces sp. NPDC001927]